MSSDLYNNQIFNCILTNINDIHAFEQKQKKKSYKHEATEEKELKVSQEFKTPFDIIKLRRKMKKVEESKQRIESFKQQLKNNTENIINTNDIDIEEYKKTWMKLTNDQRSNRINDYIRKQEIDTIKKKKLRLLLIQGITNKLLERKSINYDDENACITNIPCVQYNQGTDNYYFI